ncbi:MAG: o-succinylbenzoate synthase [Actinomycetaceae bacterium]|nr:o-succinylbenzoate synthase [Actinomycetaceae bacterium]
MTACDLFPIPISSLPASTRRVLAGIDQILLYRTALTHRFRGITSRDGLLLRGAHGWAEVSPFWDYDSAESATWLQAGLAQARSQAVTPRRSQVPVNATIPVVSAQRAAQLVAQSGGCSTVKVKVADPRSTLTQDCERLEAVRQALTEQLRQRGQDASAGRIRVDANTAWDREEAVKAIGALDRAAAGLEYVEQPCPSVADLAWVRARVEVPIAADESVRRARDPLAVARAQAADLLVVKVQPLGGAHRIHQIAEETGLPVVVSSALDSSVGLARAAQCAASLPDLPFACGLGTARLLEGDVTTRRVLSRDGAVEVFDPVVDEDVVAEPASAEQLALVERWVDRLTRMCAHIDADTGLVRAEGDLP